MTGRARALVVVVLLSSACRTYNDAPNSCETEKDCTHKGERCFHKICVLLDAATEPTGDAGDAGDADGPVTASDVRDAPAEEAPFRCNMDKDCDAKNPACNMQSGACIACTPDYCMNQMNGATPVCDLAGGKCVECTLASKNRCTDKKPACETTTNMCRACKDDTECTATSSTPACDTGIDVKAGSCVECMEPKHCSGKTGTPACDTTMKKCVQCTTSADCPNRQVCENDLCRACKEDKDCADAYGAMPGLCLIETGRCAADNDVVYVPTSCTVIGQAGNERCVSQTAVDQAIAGRKVAVILAPRTYAFDGFAVDGSGNKLIVAGRGGVRVRPVGATAPGVAITGGASVTLQDLEIDSGAAAGISVSQSTLIARRCFVHDNPAGGIVTAASAFDVENTVIAGNGPGFAGVTLGATTATPTRFVNNTVVGNGTGGVNCVSGYSVVGSIVAGNGTFQLSDMCTKPDACTTTCSAAVNATQLRTDSYRLTMTSPGACLDALMSAPFTDRKGTHRPQGANSDCGADELMH